MSVINQMLRDLDARDASEQERSGLPPKLRPLPPSRLVRGRNWQMLALGVGIGAVAAGLVFWLLSPAVPPPVPAPAPRPPAGAAVQPAPLPIDAGEMKLSTLIAQGKPPEPPAPVPKQPLPEKSAVADRPSAEAKPTVAPKPPFAAKPSPAGDAQIDKRSKDMPGREIAESEYRKGMQAVRRGDYAGAQPLLQHALELDPGAAKARQALLSVLVSGKQWAEAQQVAQGGLVIDPAQTGWAAILARLQFEQGDTPAALETLARHAAHAGNDADYQGLFAYLLQKQQRPAEAVQRFEAALALRPQEGRWWFGLGLALESAGRGGEARDAFAKAREAGNLPADMVAIVEQKLR